MSSTFPRENLGQGMLRMMGKQAAAKWTQSPAGDLTCCVIETIKEANANSLTKHQIARICEFANHAAWQHVFSGCDKTAGFPLAKVDEVVHNTYSTGDVPSPIRSNHSDWNKSPQDIFSKTAAYYTKYAEAKKEQSSVDYRKAHLGEPRCANCTGFSAEDEGVCSRVAGHIDPSYTCNSFASRYTKEAAPQVQRFSQILEEAAKKPTRISDIWAKAKPTAGKVTELAEAAEKANPSAWKYGPNWEKIPLKKTSGLPPELAEMGVRPEYIQDELFWGLRNGINEIGTRILKTARAHLDQAIVLVKEAEHHVRQGGSYEDVVKALVQLGPPQWTKTACADLIAPALDMMYLVPNPGEQVFQKIASTNCHPVDPNHPMSQAFLAMKKTASELIGLGKSWNEIWPAWEMIKEAVAPGTPTGTLTELGTGLKSVSKAGQGLAGSILGAGGKALSGAGQWVSKADPLHVLGLGAIGYGFGKPLLDRALYTIGQGLGTVKKGIQAPLVDFPRVDPHPQFGTAYR